MSEFDDNPMPPEFAAALRRQQRSQQIQTITQEMANAGGEKIETDILCDLWRDLGDHTETYWQAMACAAVFVKLDTAIFEELGKLKEQHRLRVMEALAATLTAKAKVSREIAAKREEMHRADPLPGDHA